MLIKNVLKINEASESRIEHKESIDVNVTVHMVYKTIWKLK